MFTLQVFVAVLYLALGTTSGCVSLPGRKETCCPGLGCFSDKKPWRSVVRPIPSVQCEVRAYYLLFTRENPKVPFNITSWPNFTLEGSHFDGSRETIFYIHGWTARSNYTSVHELKDVMLSYNDTNVILVDWSASSSVNYLQAVSNIRVIAAQVERLIRFMMEHHGLSAANVKLIGHSLGAHLTAYVGQSIPNLGWITGLDPAGPMFQFYPEDVRLSPDDADYVEIAHTDILVQFPILGFGENTPTGHKDFYFNKGRHQPGCFKQVTKQLLKHFWESFSPAEDLSYYLFCSHERALLYYNDAYRYRNGTYWGQKDVTKGKTCTIETCAPFGPCSKQFPTKGRFIAITTGTAPFFDPDIKVDKPLAAIYNSCMATTRPADYQNGVLNNHTSIFSMF